MTIRRTLLTMVALVLLASCGESSENNDGAGAQSTASTTTEASTSTTETTAPPLTTSTAPPDDAIVLQFAGGRVVGGIKRVTVKVGDEVTIRATSDVVEELHVHTYDQKIDLAPGVSGTVSFKATIPGRHEVEFEKSGKQAAELEVR